MFLISSGCTAVVSIRNLFDNVNKLTWFLSGSAKRKEIFLQIAADADDDLLDILTVEEDDDLAESVTAIKKGAKRKSVPKFCATRWSARVSTLSAMLAKYPTILKAMDRIMEESSGESRSDASSYIRLLEDSQFIVALTVAQAILSFLDPVTKALQAKDCNLAGA
jgi:hypothetical protein